MVAAVSTTVCPSTTLFDAIVKRVMRRYPFALIEGARYIRSGKDGSWDAFLRFVQPALLAPKFLDVLDGVGIVPPGTISAIKNDKEQLPALTANVASEIMRRIPPNRAGGKMTSSPVHQPQDVEALLVTAAVDYFVTRRPMTTREHVAFTSGRKKSEVRVPEFVETIRKVIQDDRFFGRLDYAKYHLTSVSSAQITDIDAFVWKVAEKLLTIY